MCAVCVCEGYVCLCGVCIGMWWMEEVMGCVWCLCGVVEIWGKCRQVCRQVGKGVELWGFVGKVCTCVCVYTGTGMLIWRSEDHLSLCGPRNGTPLLRSVSILPYPLSKLKSQLEIIS